MAEAGSTGLIKTLDLTGDVVLSGSTSMTKPLTDFVVDLAISTGIGIVFGIVLSAAVSSRRAGIWGESAAIAVMAVICGGYFSIDSAGGSGYLGAFLAGLIVGNMTELGLAMHSNHERDMRVLISTVADVMVILVFITLGANLPWGDISGNLAPALAVVATLVFVARPLAVLVCLLPDRRSRWTREEIVFLAWTRETGVVPAALAGIVVGLRVPHAELVVTTVALAIVVTLALQSTTKRWLARRLGLPLVKRLIELHDGTIRASSRGIGQGATFEVRLPLAPQDVELPSLEPCATPDSWAAQDVKPSAPDRRTEPTHRMQALEAPEPPGPPEPPEPPEPLDMLDTLEPLEPLEPLELFEPSPDDTA
jgi:NhaP-type Na+/H+ and K+/H+ antiporter